MGDGICCLEGNSSYIGYVDGEEIFTVGTFGSTFSETFAVFPDNGNDNGNETDKPIDIPSEVPSDVPSDMYQVMYRGRYQVRQRAVVNLFRPLPRITSTIGATPRWLFPRLTCIPCPMATQYILQGGWPQGAMHMAS